MLEEYLLNNWALYYGCKKTVSPAHRRRPSMLSCSQCAGGPEWPKLPPRPTFARSGPAGAGEDDVVGEQGNPFVGSGVVSGGAAK